MRRYCHNRACAVSHQHIIRHINRHPRAIGRVNRISAGEDACSSSFGGKAVHFAHPFGSDGVVLYGLQVIGCRDLLKHRMLRCKHSESHAVNRVDSGSEDAHDLIRVAVDGHIELNTIAAANPIALHELDAFRPVDGIKTLD